MHDLIHRHLIVTAWGTDLPTSEDTGVEWLRKLVEIVDMQILMDAKAIYCEDLANEGLTGVVGLTTSHSSFHSWHTVDKPFVNFDLYSCRDFNIESVFSHFKQFGITEYSYILLDRNDGRNEIIERNNRVLG